MKQLGIGVLIAVLLACTVSVVSTDADAANPSITDIDYSSDNGFIDIETSGCTGMLLYVNHGSEDLAFLLVTDDNVHLNTQTLEAGSYTINLFEVTDPNTPVMTYPFSIYTVEFDANGGNGTMDPVYATGTYVPPTEASGMTGPDGAEFLGWSTTADGSPVGSVEITGDTTLFAVWDTGSVEPGQYTVSFDLNGGEGEFPSQQIDEGGTVSEPSTEPTMEGHTFLYWSLDGEEYQFGTPVTGNITLVAQWQVNTYTVTWEDEDGTVLEEDLDVPYGTMPSYNGETPEKESDDQYDYAFAGWTPALSEVRGDVTYTATYSETEREYTVSVADGIVNGTVTLSVTGQVAYGTEVTITVTPADGYRLDTLYINGVPTSDRQFTVEGDTEVRATFVLKSVPVVEHDVSIDIIGEEGWGTVTGPETIRDGSSATFTIGAANGYVIETVTATIGGVEVGEVDYDSMTSAKLRLSGVTGDVTIEVTFREAAQYTITVDAGEGEYQLPEGPYYEGRDVTITVTAPILYMIDVDKTVVTGSDSYEIDARAGTITINGISANVDITVEYVFVPSDDDDDEPVNPPVNQKGDDDTTTYIVAIAAAAVVAILAALILMQSRKS